MAPDHADACSSKWSGADKPLVVTRHQSPRQCRIAQDALFGLFENGALTIAFHIDKHISALRKLHQKYRDRPVSLADACIVRMAEIYERHAVLTLNSDLSVYRKHGRVPLVLIHPAQG